MYCYSTKSKTMKLAHPKQFITQVDMIILDHISDESFTIEDLSKLLHLSNSQVYRKIRKKTGLNPFLPISRLNA